MTTKTKPLTAKQARKITDASLDKAAEAIRYLENHIEEATAAGHDSARVGVEIEGGVTDEVVAVFKKRGYAVEVEPLTIFDVKWVEEEEPYLFFFKRKVHRAEPVQRPSTRYQFVTVKW